MACWNRLGCPLLDETSRKVQIWFEGLKELQRIKVPRNLQRRGTYIVKSISLYTFVDASQCAYGGVVYVRSDSKMVSVTLGAAKTKLAPLQSISTP